MELCASCQKSDFPYAWQKISVAPTDYKLEGWEFCEWSKFQPIPRRSRSSILSGFDEHFQRYKWYLRPELHEECVLLFRDTPDADKILEDTHVINGRETSIRRVLFLCGLPAVATKEELMGALSDFGNVEEYEIHMTNSMHDSRLLHVALVLFDSEKPVDDLSARGTVDVCGVQVKMMKVRLVKVPTTMIVPPCDACFEFLLASWGGRLAPKRIDLPKRIGFIPEQSDIQK